MDFGLFSYISEKIYGEDGTLVEKKDEQLETAEEKKTEEEKSPVEEKKEEVVTAQVIAPEIPPEIVKPENVVVAEVVVEKKEEEIKLSIDPASAVQNVLTEEKKDERETRIIFHSKMKISIKMKYQVLPGTNIKDGFCEEYHFRGLRCCGPLKSKVNYVNDKKHGTEFIYDIQGNITQQNEYVDGEYIKTWYETIFGK